MTKQYISFRWHYYQNLCVSGKRKNEKNFESFSDDAIMITANDQFLGFCYIKKYVTYKNIINGD